MEIEAVITKIRKLCDKTVERGCTEHEALAAAAKVGELLRMYNLSLDKVFLEQQTCIQGYVCLKTKNRGSVDGCVTAIAAMCDCKVWFNHGWGNPSQYVFFGLDTDVEMAKYLYTNISSAVEAETKAFKSSLDYTIRNVHGKHLVTSFQKGMAYRIICRLQDMTSLRRKQESEPVSQGEAVTSIVLVKHKKVETEYEKLGLHLTTVYRKNRNVHHDAYNIGKQAGERVNLTRPVGSHPVGCLV